MSFDIDESLNKIKNAIYGKDVRQAIYDCIMHLKQNIAGTYTLPTASKNILGGVKLGDLFALDSNSNLLFSDDCEKRFKNIEENTKAINTNKINIELHRKALAEHISLKPNVMNVLHQYEGINTGIKDALEPVERCIEELDSVWGGGTLFFPNGTYYFSSHFNVPSNIKILGDTKTIFTSENPWGNNMRTSSFIRVGDASKTEYSSFENVEINNIIFDLGGSWELEDKKLSYKAKFKNGTYYSYCPIAGWHGKGLKIKNCTFKNGIYAGYTGSGSSAVSPISATNPHILDLIGIKDILIEGCVFEPVFTTTTAITNWGGKAYGETGEADVNFSDMIQLDGAYGSANDPGADYTCCKNVVIRKNHFIGLPDYNWDDVENNTGDNDSLLKTEIYLCDNQGNATTNKLKIHLAHFRFSPVAAIGGCHLTDKEKGRDCQPKDVEIYNNIFEGIWSSHYSGINTEGKMRWGKNHNDSYMKDGYYYPIIDGSPDNVLLYKEEPARHGCHGAIYALPGAKNFNVHDNTFKTTSTNNKSTAVFFYGSEAGIVHNNTIINYGEPFPAGIKTKSMSTYNCFSTTDLWQKNTTGYYDGLLFSHSKNNIWIRDGYSSSVLNSSGLNILTELNREE